MDKIIFILLIGILWIVNGFFIIRKLEESDITNFKDDYGDTMVGLKIFTIVISPLVLVVAMIRRTFFEKWG